MAASPAPPLGNPTVISRPSIYSSTSGGPYTEASSRPLPQLRLVRDHGPQSHPSGPASGNPAATAACGGTLDAGWDEPRGPIPVDERDPIILCNDGAFDNWQGEHAILFANSGGPALAAIVINSAWPWTDIDENMAGWQQMVDAARASGLQGIPDPVASESPALIRPENEDIEATQPNGSEGARLIIELS